MELEQLKYPIGNFKAPEVISPDMVKEGVQGIKQLPQQIHAALKGLVEGKLDTQYREGGWTLRQLVHHIADSHMNALIRFKLALTEDIPFIKPYKEDLWAELADSQMDIKPSLNLIESLHERWGCLLDTLTNEQMERKLFHPEKKSELDLKHMLMLYQWHGLHHLAHIKMITSK